MQNKIAYIIVIILIAILIFAINAWQKSEKIPIQKIEKTLTQFSTVDKVEISVPGFIEPLQP